MLVNILPEDEAASTTYFDATDDATPVIDRMIFKKSSDLHP